MSKYLSFLLLVSLTFGNSNLKPDPLEIGQACDGYPPFQINAFNVVPWPPTFGQPMTFTMQGVFQMNVPVAYLATGQTCDNQSWEYNQYPINENFSAGQSYTFSEQISSGSSTGNCYLQITLHGAPPESLFVTCWQVNYVLN